MNKKRIVIIITSVLIIIVLVGIYMLYSTFAINSYASSNNDIYNITLTEDNTTITVPSNSSKTVYYHINNTNKGNVKYGVGYTTSSNIEVLVYENSKDKVEDTIGYKDDKYIKLYLKNNSDTDGTVTLKTILGYENGGDLIVPTNTNLITKTHMVTMSGYITNLYGGATKSQVINDNTTYQYDTTNSLMQDTDGNIRYYGSSPNNYIYFNCESYPSTNCELWRIIGLFNNKLKIIRNSSIGASVWDTSASDVNSGYGVNEWQESDLMKLLNPGYESESVGGSLYYNSKSGTCYTSTSNASTTCDFTENGIKNEATKDMMSYDKWYLGRYNNADISVKDIYMYERIISSDKNIWEGRIAIAYPSDYGYATDLSKCNTTLSLYDNTDCINNNWLFNILQSNWLLTPYNNSITDAWNVSSTGIVRSSYYTSTHRSVTPTLYLKSQIEIVSGSGTQDEPYMLINNT